MEKRLFLLAGILTVSALACPLTACDFGGSGGTLYEAENSPVALYRSSYSEELEQPTEDIVLDGVLDEDIWQSKAYYSSGFCEDYTGSMYAHYRFTAFPAENGVWIGAEATDSNLRRYNDYGSLAPEYNSGWEFYFFCLEKGTDQNQLQPTIKRNYFLVDVNGNVTSPTGLSALARVHVDGVINSKETEGMSFEMFIPYSELGIDVSEGIPDCFNVLPVYRTYLPGASSITRTNVWPFPWIYSPAYYRFGENGYLNADAEGATVGDAPGGFAKSANWDVSAESESVVESVGAMWQYIFFRDIYASKVIMKATVQIKGTLASCDSNPKAGIMMMDSAQNQYAFLLDYRHLSDGQFSDALSFTLMNYRIAGNTSYDSSVIPQLSLSAPVTEVELALVKDGGEIAFYVNGTKLYEVSSKQYTSNTYVGFYSESANAVYSDYAASAFSTQDELEQLAAEYGINL